MDQGYLVSGMTEVAQGGTIPESRYFYCHPEDRLEIFGVVEDGAVLYLWMARHRRFLRFCHVQCHDVHVDVLSTETGVFELNDLCYDYTQSPSQTV